jgi:hypothetical protein
MLRLHGLVRPIRRGNDDVRVIIIVTAVIPRVIKSHAVVNAATDTAAICALAPSDGQKEG